MLRLPHLDNLTVQEMGWAEVRNGEWLRRTEEQFYIMENFFSIVSALQKKPQVKLHVTAKAS